MKQATMGIIVGGGPAPGINGVIGAAAIEANNRLMYDQVVRLIERHSLRPAVQTPTT